MVLTERDLEMAAVRVGYSVADPCGVVTILHLAVDHGAAANEELRAELLLMDDIPIGKAIGRMCFAHKGLLFRGPRVIPGEPLPRSAMRLTSRSDIARVRPTRTARSRPSATSHATWWGVTPRRRAAS